MRPTNRTEDVQCEDCGEWMPLPLFLKHWHDDETTEIGTDPLIGLAYNVNYK